MPSLDFRPHPLLRGAHLQTISAALLHPSGTRYRAVEHHVELADGDRIVLHDDCPPQWSNGEPVCLLMHGMAGCHRSPYMIRLADQLSGQGIRVFRMDARGCGAGRDFATGITHAARSDDAHAALLDIQRRCPHSPIDVVGVSLGGNILLKLLGELPGSDSAAAGTLDALRRCVAVAPPIEPAVCSRNLGRRSLSFYCRYFIRLLINRVPPGVAASETWQRLPYKNPPRKLWDFDDAITSQLAGYHDAAEYYEASRAGKVLERIETPTLILAAQDDPLIPAAIFDRGYPPSVQLHLARRGGHVGFIGRRPQRYWMDDVILDYLETGRGGEQ